MPTPSILTPYDPENFLVSLTRAIKAYVIWGMNAFLGSGVVYNSQTNTSGVIDVIMEYPPAGVEVYTTPLPRSILHFEIDSVDGELVGFGNNIFKETYDEVEKFLIQQEGSAHRVNFDVGIWTSDKSGGTTMRLMMRQALDQIFLGVKARNNFKLAVDNGNGSPEILSFSGGGFIVENLNDVKTYRMIDCTLELRCYSRSKADVSDAVPTIEEIDQAPGLTIVP